MQPLPEALAGWSVRYEITDRAVLMGAHARAGNVQRAEEYAVEIEALQRAQDERAGIAPRQMPLWAVSEWRIGHAAWARMLVHGWRCGRGVWAADGWTAENVAAEARRVNPLHHFAACDVIRLPLALGRAA